MIIRGREISTLLDKIEVSRVSPVYPTATANPTASLMPTQIPALTATPITETLIPTPPPVPPTAIPTESLAPESPTPTETSVPPTPVPPTVIPPTAGPTSQPSVDTVYDDKDSAFVYSGWYNVGKVQAYGGSYKQTTEYSSVATLNFTGQSFSILYKSGPKYGMLHVFIDGTMMGFIDQNERPQAYQRRWDFPGQLSSGPHTLTLVFVSPDMKASLDAVIVR